MRRTRYDAPMSTKLRDEEARYVRQLAEARDATVSETLRGLVQMAMRESM